MSLSDQKHSTITLSSTKVADLHSLPDHLCTIYKACSESDWSTKMGVLANRRMHLVFGLLFLAGLEVARKFYQKNRISIMLHWLAWLIMITNFVAWNRIWNRSMVLQRFSKHKGLQINSINIWINDYQFRMFFSFILVCT